MSKQPRYSNKDQEVSDDSSGNDSSSVSSYESTQEEAKTSKSKTNNKRIGKNSIDNTSGDIYNRSLDENIRIRDSYLHGNLFKVDYQAVHKELGEEFDRLEDLAIKRSKSSISKGDLNKSSQTSMILPGTMYTPSKSMNLFCFNWIGRNDLKVDLDLRYKGMYIVPLSKIVLNTDTSFILNLSKQTTRIKDNKADVPKYFVCFCPSICQPQAAFVRKIIVSFFSNYFDKDSTEIMKNDLEKKIKKCMH